MSAPKKQELDEFIEKAIAHRGSECADLTAEQISEIRASSEPKAVLVTRYGVSRGTIYNVQNRRGYYNF